MHTCAGVLMFAQWYAKQSNTPPPHCHWHLPPLPARGVQSGDAGCEDCQLVDCVAKGKGSERPGASLSASRARALFSVSLFVSMCVSVCVCVPLSLSRARALSLCVGGILPPISTANNSTNPYLPPPKQALQPCAYLGQQVR